MVVQYTKFFEKNAKLKKVSNERLECNVFREEENCRSVSWAVFIGPGI